jgi:hypothetical protein
MKLAQDCALWLTLVLAVLNLRFLQTKDYKTKINKGRKFK